MILYLVGLNREVFGSSVLSQSGIARGLLRAKALVCFTALIAACSTISQYDQTAYLQAVNTKVDALALMDKAVEPYSNHRNDVAAFQIELEKTYEYERGRPLNRDTIMQWDILRDPTRDL